MLSLFQATGDLIITILIRVCEINKLPANLNESRLQASRSSVDKGQHSHPDGKNCIKRDCESFTGINFCDDIGKHARPQLAVWVWNIDANHGGAFYRIDRRANHDYSSFE